MLRAIWLVGCVENQRRLQASLVGLGVLVGALAAASPATAATFGALTGTLSVRAGDNAPKSTPAVVGSLSLFDNDLTPSTGGFHQASSFLSITRLGGYSVLFSGVAASVTTQNATTGTNATASLNFSQAFTTTSQQWLEFTAKVDDPAGVEVTSLVTLTRSGQPAPLYTQSHSNGRAITQHALIPAGTYTLQGAITTSAAAANAHSGVIDGSILIASLANFNQDAFVNGLDLATLRTKFGSTTGQFADGDADGNGRTDGNDILLWQRQLGTTLGPTPIASPIPEPASGLLAAGAVLAAARYCRMRRSAARRASASPAR